MFQPIEIWNLIQDTGEYRCGPSKGSMIEPEFQEKYRWLCRKMTERIGPPPEGVELPLWAWYMQNGKHKKPDLRSERWICGPSDVDYTCIELEIPENQVLLSDFELWHSVLNDWLISFSEAEDDRIHEYYNSLSPEARRAYKDKNWEQIFDISFFESKWIRRGYMIQATFWVLSRDMIRDVRFFRTGKYKSKPLASDDNLPGQIG
jgi:hypothetical protein